MKHINKLLVVMVAMTQVGCASLDQPRTQERQQISDRCWGWGSDNTGVYLATLIFKPVVCMANDLTQGQPQLAAGSIQGRHIITDRGTYSVITSPVLTTVHKTTK